jgi:hypothetical protein
MIIFPRINISLNSRKNFLFNKFINVARIGFFMSTFEYIFVHFHLHLPKVKAQNSIISLICHNVWLYLSTFFVRQNNRNIRAESINRTRERLRQQDGSSNDHTSSNPETCPICLNSTCFCIETNCAHKFCGNKALI